MKSLFLRPMTERVIGLIACILLIGVGADAKELLKNRDFSGSLDPWVVKWHDGKVEDLDIEAEDGEIRIQVSLPSKALYTRLMQPVRVKEGKTYTLSFEAKTDAEISKNSRIGVKVGQLGRPFESYGLKERAVLENEWQAYSYTFTATEIDSDNEPCLFFSFGQVPGNVFFKSVSLTDQ